MLLKGKHRRLLNAIWVVVALMTIIGMVLLYSVWIIFR